MKSQNEQIEQLTKELQQEREIKKLLREENERLHQTLLTIKMVLNLAD